MLCGRVEQTYNTSIIDQRLHMNMAKGKTGGISNAAYNLGNLHAATKHIIIISDPQISSRIESTMRYDGD